jgi:hypothetical protein
MSVSELRASRLLPGCATKVTLVRRQRRQTRDSSRNHVKVAVNDIELISTPPCPFH